jgi:hypothetical protein
MCWNWTILLRPFNCHLVYVYPRFETLLIRIDQRYAFTLRKLRPEIRPLYIERCSNKELVVEKVETAFCLDHISVHVSA